MGMQLRMLVVCPLMISIIASAETANYLMEEPPFPEHWNAWFIAMCFGVQSSVTFAGMGVPTMLATGHMTSMHCAVMEILSGKQPLSSLFKQATLYSFTNTLWILIGAIAGAYANVHSNHPILAAYLMTPITLFQMLLMTALEIMAREREAPTINGEGTKPLLPK